jgi:uncharacterized protein (DUF1800 family)
MGYLDPHTLPLTAKTASHLLRRATFGPTKQEISSFTGLSAADAVDLLISNGSYTVSPPPPVEMNDSDSGEQFLTKPFNGNRNYDFFLFVRYWWIGLMTQQNGHPSILEKLTAFWQNHFVVSFSVVDDYRLIDRYLRFLRTHALGDFRAMTVGMTKDPGMLIFQNGNENEKEHPNENYARELQELFTVGQKDFAGNDNYTEDDVKAAARVLTGWQVNNYLVSGSTTFGATFNADRHDIADKSFSHKYNNTNISGRQGPTAGDEELVELVDMLLDHPQTPRFICRKLYRWYVNPNVTQEIENEVIVPLAAFFASPANNFAIAPVLKKLLSSQLFFDDRNIGAIVKSPAEHTIGTLRFFSLPVPDITTEYKSFRQMMEFIEWRMTPMGLHLLLQQSVFGAPPYYQTGYSKNWINGTTLGFRGQTIDNMVYPWLEVKPGYMLGIDFLKWIKEIQPNFLDVAGTPAITAEQVVNEFSKNMYAIELTPGQKSFLIDTIMMRSIPHKSWEFELNAYRSAPNDVDKQNPILWRCQPLVQYMMKMAEYQVF